MPRPRTDIRARILKAARERFGQAGVDGTSLRSIAADARTSLGMIYYYFPSKDALFLAVVEDVYARLLGDLEAALAGADDFAGRVLALYRRIGAVSPLEVDVVRLVAREVLSSSVRASPSPSRGSDFFSVSFASPKSKTFTRRSRRIMMFSGLMSRCTIPASCADAKAETTCAAMPSASRSPKRPRRRRARKVSPSTYCMAMKRRPSASPTSWTVQTFG